MQPKWIVSEGLLGQQLWPLRDKNPLHSHIPLHGHVLRHSFKHWTERISRSIQIPFCNSRKDLEQLLTVLFWRCLGYIRDNIDHHNGALCVWVSPICYLHGWIFCRQYFGWRETSPSNDALIITNFLCMDCTPSGVMSTFGFKAPATKSSQEMVPRHVHKPTGGSTGTSPMWERVGGQQVARGPWSQGRTEASWIWALPSPP